MSTMSTVTDVLQAVGVGDQALTYMGPTLTIVIAWLGAIGVAQLVKFPLSKLVSQEWYSYVVRIVGVLTAFSLAHELSNHLSVTMEVVVAVMQPTIYLGLLAATRKFAPWLANTVFKTVGPPP